MIFSIGRQSPIYTHESTSSDGSSDLKKILYKKFLSITRSYETCRRHRVVLWLCVTIQSSHGSCNSNKIVVAKAVVHVEFVRAKFVQFDTLQSSKHEAFRYQ